MIALLIITALCCIELVRQYAMRVFETPEQGLARSLRTRRQAFQRAMQERA